MIIQPAIEQLSPILGVQPLYAAAHRLDKPSTDPYDITAFDNKYVPIMTSSLAVIEAQLTGFDNFAKLPKKHEFDYGFIRCVAEHHIKVGHIAEDTLPEAAESAGKNALLDFSGWITGLQIGNKLTTDPRRNEVESRRIKTGIWMFLSFEQPKRKDGLFAGYMVQLPSAKLYNPKFNLN